MTHPMLRQPRPWYLLAALLLSGTAMAQTPNLQQMENKVEQAAHGAGAYVDDAALTARVKAALAADKGVKGMDVSVETRQNTVLLSGFVDSQEQAWRAAQIAAGVEGVKAVSNDLHLKAKGGEGAAGYLSDAAITGRVKADLLADGHIPSTAISVKTDNGRVQLAGYVASRDEARRAEAIVRRIKDVKAVKNDLRIK